MSGEICFKPIGVVEKGLPRLSARREHRSRYEIESIIRIYEEYVEGLEGIEEYSHIIVIYVMHEEDRVRIKVKPWGRDDLPEVGIFATRFPPRPNHIALSVVELIRVEPPKLKVRGLDAWSGSPVIDIKPYDYYDVVRNPRIPEWLLSRWNERANLYRRIAPWLGPQSPG
ncbi:MAG: tRNA (N6-threonylcarbamoyladenosine(37)-N6)-methyltransferase TrmO [Desulfurococcales archaeon]|nr:tRNA (N6-threonylcarbamoyladenosine(37)-N6)-methyltransferase TrmO [Desulfurococcales archaeon]